MSQPDLLQLDAGPKILFEDDFSDGKLDTSAWSYWRVNFQEKADGKLHVVGNYRPGFFYGNAGNGRGAMLMSHIGDKSWTDYRLEVEFEATGIGSWNPATVPTCFKIFEVIFRVQDAKESWNAQASTYYSFGVATATCTAINNYQGHWNLTRKHGWYMTDTGYDQSKTKGSVVIVHPSAGGTLVSSHFVDGPNKVVVEVKGDNIKIFVQDSTKKLQQIADFTDTAPNAIMYGGIGFMWRWEGLGWIDNVKVTELK